MRRSLPLWSKISREIAAIRKRGAIVDEARAQRVEKQACHHRGVRNEATTTESIGDEIARLAAELTVGEHRLVRKIGDFDASGDWARQGALTCAHWLAWRIVLAPGAAREKVRVARALPTLPHIDHAFERGELSYSKVRAVTRVPRKVSRQCGADCSSSSAGSLAMTRGS